MNIAVNDRKQIAALKQEFNAVFPYLKLEFSQTIDRTVKSTRKDIRSFCATLGECRRNQCEGHLTIEPAMRVCDLQNRFGKIYGIGVLIFRKSGRSWLETTVTNYWTLEEQNKQGEELSKWA